VTEAKGSRRPPGKRRRAHHHGDGGGPGWLDRLIRRAVLFVLGIALRAGLLVALVIGAAVAVIYQDLPEPETLLDGRARGSVTLLDRHGDVFAWRGDQFGGDVRVGDVSPWLVKAILAAEDRRFYRHWGLDPRGLARAVWVNVRAGRVVQGGSTITQQVAKNVFLSHERSLDRKLKEVPMALAMELKYDKDEILAVYLNRVYLGAGAYGFEAASQRYFGKSARYVNPAEAAMLAGLLRAPSRFAPTSDIARSRARATTVLAAMRETGALSEAEYDRARANPARLSDAAAARAGGHFADWIMEDGPTYLTRGTSEDVTIRTTFDPTVQRAAEEALTQVFEEQVRPGSRAQAAIVVMSPDGAVRAMVGGRDGRQGTFNRATQARRQTGSAFKTFVYAAAVERGARPSDTVMDAPVTVAGWSPTNYDGGFAGAVTLRQAFAESLNTAAVRVSEQIAGRDRVRSVALKLGLTGHLADGPALALGVSEATPLEMAGAYGAFVSGGFNAEPFGIREIRLRGDAAPLMTGGDGPRRRVLDSRVAGYVTAMMRAVVEEGTGQRARLPGREAAGKTGTTQAARDAWFVGFTADYVTAVWMGYDDNTPLTGVTGGGLPAAIWRETMARIHRGLPARPLPALEDTPRRPSTAVAAASPRDDDETVLGAILNDVIDAIRRNTAPAPRD
jgi:1A family penicillin-binding protein